MNCFLATSLTDKISTCIFGACQSLVSWNLGAVVTVAKWLELLAHDWEDKGLIHTTCNLFSGESVPLKCSWSQEKDGGKNNLSYPALTSLNKDNLWTKNPLI